LDVYRRVQGFDVVEDILRNTRIAVQIVQPHAGRVVDAPEHVPPDQHAFAHVKLQTGSLPDALHIWPADVLNRVAFDQGAIHIPHPFDAAHATGRNVVAANDVMADRLSLCGGSCMPALVAHIDAASIGAADDVILNNPVVP